MSGEHHVELMPPGLAALMSRAEQAKARPVEQWNPAHCGTIDIAIDSEGHWFHLGAPILRPALVKLFASVLRRESDGGHVLVTPAEKLSIRVDDVAFQAVEMHAAGEGEAAQLTFRTNVGDVVEAGPDHPLRFAIDAGDGGFKPYVHVRGRLEARLSRALAFELVGLAVEVGTGVWSGGAFFAFPPEAAA